MHVFLSCPICRSWTMVRATMRSAEILLIIIVILSPKRVLVDGWLLVLPSAHLSTRQNLLSFSSTSRSSIGAGRNDDDCRGGIHSLHHESRRIWICKATVASAAVFSNLVVSPPESSNGSDFAPGGTLVDYKVGVSVGNTEASSSRKADNSNVLFDRDFYFKFGTAAPWISPGSTDFPKTIPFVRSQQRYDALKKYQDRISQGVATIRALEKMPPAAMPDPTAVDVYYLRPMGLLANSLLASENTGSTNELYLARWYINEILLRAGDIRNDSDEDARRSSYVALKKALNSYLSLVNRAITEKVGDKFEYI